VNFKLSIEEQKNENSINTETTENQNVIVNNSQIKQEDSTQSKKIFTDFSEKTKKRLEKDAKKQQRKYEKKKKKEEKMKNFDAKYGSKIRKILHEQFYGILDEERIHYTITFFIAAILIAFFSLFSKEETWPMTTSTFLSAMFFIGFLILMIFTMMKSISMYMFGPIKEWKYKIIIIGVAMAIGLILTTLLFIYTDPSKMPIVFLQHDKLLPVSFIMVFVGWNVIQIHFIKDGLERPAMKAEIKLIEKNPEKDKQILYAKLFLIIGMAFPFILHILTSWGFYILFNQFEDPSNPTQQELTALNIFWAWFVVSIILISIMDFWQFRLYKKSIQYNKPNVFSNIFYMLLWVILWFRSFGFINSFRTATKLASDTFIILGNMLLLVMTSILVLRGLSEKVKKGQYFHEESIPFLVYALTILYVAGQISLILIGFGTRDQVNMFNNSLILITSIAYYFWYSKYTLERKNMIAKSSLTKDEVINLFIEFTNSLSTKLNDQANLIQNELDSFLDKTKLKILKREVEKEKEKERLPDKLEEIEKLENKSS